jgi:uncharacterized protein (DUF3084 family)
MRKAIWFVATALLAGGAACKKDDTEKAASEVRKAQEKVQEESQDVREEAKDVREEAKDVAEERKELSEAEQRLMQSREQLKSSVTTRLANIDSKLAILEQRTDPVSKKLAADLKMRRDQVSQRVNAVDSIAISSWDTYQKEVEDNLKVLENDLDEALDTEDRRTDRDRTIDGRPVAPPAPAPNP